MPSSSVKLLYQLRDPNADGAWERFIEIYTPLIFHWLSKRGLKPNDAADIVQDVLITVLRRLSDFDTEGPGRFRGWLRTITANRATDFYRRQKHRRETEGGTALMAISEIAETDLWEDSEYRLHLVTRAFELLRQEFQDATWSAAHAQIVEGRSAGDVAKSLGTTVNAAYIAKSRLMARLHDELDGLLD